MIFTEKQKARYDKYIHPGGNTGDGELWNRQDLYIIIHGLLGKRLTKRAVDGAKRGSKSKAGSGKSPRN